MKVFSFPIVIFACSLLFSSCSSGKEEVGNPILLPTMMPRVEEGRLGTETEIPHEEKILIYVDSMHCGACQIMRLRGLQQQIKRIDKPVYIVLDAPQVEIRPLLNMIYSSKMDIPVFFDLNHEIAIKNREQLDKRSSVHVWRLDDNNVLLEKGEENVLMKGRF